MRWILNHKAKNILLFLISLASQGIHAQYLSDSTKIRINKSWAQEPAGYTYPIKTYVPKDSPPNGGFPVCILLHGNGQSGASILNKYRGILKCHALIAPTGYKNSWNICREGSNAPDVEMMGDIIDSLQNFVNVNSSKIRILGVSNGGGLANRFFIENDNPNVDIVCAIVSQLNEPQYHLGSFYKPVSSTDPRSKYCGYDSIVLPLVGRNYLGISNNNDSLIPYMGGFSPVGVNFIEAQRAAFLIAKSQGYKGPKITGGGSPIGSPTIFEFSYLSGKVVHLMGDAKHSVNKTQLQYIEDYFSDCQVPTGMIDHETTRILAYPNPFHSSISIQRVSSKASIFSIDDFLGQNVFVGKFIGDQLDIDLSTLNPGIYTLKIDHKFLRLVKK